MSVAKGKYQEDRALDYLNNQGLSLVERNYHGRYGEIDLIMKMGKTVVFVEVRYRKSSYFGTALESVGYQKQQKIIKTAQYYLQKHQLTDKIGTRFDVIAMSQGHLEWIKDAFSL